jgi:hypothetical protein
MRMRRWQGRKHSRSWEGPRHLTRAGERLQEKRLTIRGHDGEAREGHGVRGDRQKLRGQSNHGVQHGKDRDSRGEKRCAVAAVEQRKVGHRGDRHHPRSWRSQLGRAPQRLAQVVLLLACTREHVTDT